MKDKNLDKRRKIMKSPLIKLILILSIFSIPLYFSVKKYKGENFDKSQELTLFFKNNRGYSKSQAIKELKKKGVYYYLIKGKGNIQSESGYNLDKSEIGNSEYAIFCRIPNVGHQMFNQENAVIILFFDNKDELTNTKVQSRFYGL